LVSKNILCKRWERKEGDVRAEVEWGPNLGGKWKGPAIQNSVTENDKNAFDIHQTLKF
jgi:hypothetical protein